MIPTSEFLRVDKENKIVYCEKDGLVVHIPEKYKTYGMLNIEKQISTLGIFDMYFENELIGGLLLAAIVKMEPSKTHMKTIDGKAYVILKFNKGDIFIANTDVIQVPSFMYSLFVEFMSLSNLPKFLSYNDLSLLFDYIGKVCGVSFKINHSVFESLYTYMYRLDEDPNVFYRHTDMTKEGLLIGLNSITYGPNSTLTKVAGSRFNDGLNAALVNPVKERSELEDLMRT